MEESSPAEYFNFIDDSRPNPKTQQEANGLFGVDDDFRDYQDLTQQTQMEVDSIDSEDVSTTTSDRFFGDDDDDQDEREIEHLKVSSPAIELESLAPAVEIPQRTPGKN